MHRVFCGDVRNISEEKIKELFSNQEKSVYSHIQFDATMVIVIATDNERCDYTLPFHGVLDRKDLEDVSIYRNIRDTIIAHLDAFDKMAHWKKEQLVRSTIPLSFHIKPMAKAS